MRSGPWSPTQIESWLDATVIPLRVASAGKRGPLVQSLWFQYASGALWCATQRDSVLARRIQRDANVGWEVSPDEPPYRGVRGTGHAHVVDDAAQVSAVLTDLISRYGQADTQLATWLLGRVESEVAVRIEDLRVTSWDFSSRM